MNRNLWLISKSILMLAICLTLIGAITVTAQAKLPIEQIPQQEHQLAGEIDGEIQAGGTISGTVTCLGFISDSTSDVYVALHDELFDVVTSDHILCGETYELSTADDGTYLVSAFLDENNSGDGPPDPGEPDNFTDPIEISPATPIHTDIDLELYRYVERVSLFGDKGDPLEEREYDSEEPAISGDGRYVVFYSEEGSYNRGVHIFDRELDTSTWFGVDGYFDWFYAPDISADGNYVAAAYYHHPIEEDATARLFIKEWADEDSPIVIVIEPWEAVTYPAFNSPSISGNGSRVAFEFVYGSEEVRQIYLYDDGTELTTLISGTATDGGVPSDGYAYDPAISDDGLFVAFKSSSTDLVDPPLTDNELRIYVHDIAAGTTELIPLPDGITEGSFNSAPSISGDGHLVAYQLDYDIYIYDRDTDKTIMIPPIDNAVAEDSYNPSISGNGRFVAYESYLQFENAIETEIPWYNNINIYDLELGTIKIAKSGFENLPDEYPEHPAISYDGRFIAFDADAESLVVDDLNGTKDVFVYMNAPALTIDIIGNGSVPHQSTYDFDRIITLTPVPDDAYAFDGWGGDDELDLDDNGDGTWSIEMDEDKSLIANFKIAKIYIYLPMILK